MSKKKQRNSQELAAPSQGVIDDIHVDDIHVEVAREACGHLESQTSALDNKAGIGIGLAGAFLVAAIDLRPLNFQVFTSSGNIWIRLSAIGSVAFLACGIVAFVLLWQALKTRDYGGFRPFPDQQEREDEGARREDLYKAYKDMYTSYTELNKTRLDFYKKGMRWLFWTFLGFLLFVSVTPN